MSDDPERAWSIFLEAFTHADDDEKLISVGYELRLMLHRHWDLLHTRAEAFADQHPRFKRILGERFFDEDRYREKTFTTEELIDAYRTMLHYASNAHRLNRLMKTDPRRALLIAIEIMHRAKRENIPDSDADDPFQELLRQHADAVIDAAERVARESYIVRRAIWRMRRRRDNFDAAIAQRLLAARGETTDFSDDHSPDPEPRTLSKLDEEIIHAWFEHERHFWAFDEVDELTKSQPENAWSVILQLLARAEDESMIFAIAAGPLEDLLHEHRTAFFDRAHKEAETNERLRTALSGVRLSDV